MFSLLFLLFLLLGSVDCSLILIYYLQIRCIRLTFLQHITLFINNSHQLQMGISDVCKYMNIVKSLLEGQNCKSICICTFLKNKTHQSYRLLNIL